MVATHPAFFIMNREKRVQPVEDDRSSGPLVLLVLLGIVPYVYKFRSGSFIRHRADSPEHFSRPREYVFYILIQMLPTSTRRPHPSERRPGTGFSHSNRVRAPCEQGATPCVPRGMHCYIRKTHEYDTSGRQATLNFRTLWNRTSS